MEPPPALLFPPPPNPELDIPYFDGETIREARLSYFYGALVATISDVIVLIAHFSLASSPYRRKSFHMKLISYRCGANIVGFMTHIISYAGQYPRIEDNQAISHETCQSLGAAYHGSLLSANSWFLCIALDIFLQVLDPFTDMAALRKHYHFVGWVVPFILCPILGSQELYGVSAFGFCFIRARPDPHEVNIVTLVFFYVPLLIVWTCSVLCLSWIGYIYSVGGLLRKTRSLYWTELRHGIFEVFTIGLVWTFLGTIWFLQYQRDDDDPILLTFFSIGIGMQGVLDLVTWTYCAEPFCTNRDQGQLNDPGFTQTLRTDVKLCIGWGIMEAIITRGSGEQQKRRSVYQNAMSPSKSPSLSVNVPRKAVSMGGADQVRRGSSTASTPPPPHAEDYHTSFATSVVSLSERHNSLPRGSRTSDPLAAPSTRPTRSTFSSFYRRLTSTISGPKRYSHSTAGPPQEAPAGSSSLPAAPGNPGQRLPAASSPGNLSLLPDTAKFLTYSPQAFAEMRYYAGLADDEYLRSFAPEAHAEGPLSPHAARDHPQAGSRGSQAPPDPASSLEERKMTGGQSGSFFYLTRDHRFIVKTVTRYESQLLQQVLPRLVQHTRAHPGSLITRFTGLHSIKMYPGHRPVHFVIMTNIFPHPAQLHEMYDIKGSWVSRGGPKGSRAADAGPLSMPFVQARRGPPGSHSLSDGAGSPRSLGSNRALTITENPLNSLADAPEGPRAHHESTASSLSEAEASRAMEHRASQEAVGPSSGAVEGVGGAEARKVRVLKDMDLTFRLRLPAEAVGDLTRRLAVDSEFLRGLGIMDYSLLIGLKYEPRASNDHIDGGVMFDRPVYGGGFAEVHEALASGAGGAAAPVRGCPVQYGLGVIDILQTYNFPKRLERYCKVLLFCRDPLGISAIGPRSYQARFMERARLLLGGDRNPDAEALCLLVQQHSNNLPDAFQGGGALVPAAPQDAASPPSMLLMVPDRSPSASLELPTQNGLRQYSASESQVTANGFVASNARKPLSHQDSILNPLYSS